MIIPLTISDFLDRAVTVYPDRVAVVDEPDQPAQSWGEITFADLGDLARRQAATLDELGVPVGGRVAIVSHNAARFLASFYGVAGWGRVLVPINFRLSVPEIQYIVEHSGAEVLLVDPELEHLVAEVPCKRTFVLGRDDNRIWGPNADPKPWVADAATKENATATINYTSGTTARPKGVQLNAPQQLDQRGRVRLAGNRYRSRRVPAHAAHLPCQRLGTSLRHDCNRRKERRPTQS